jgi:hypothetical protein
VLALAKPSSRCYSPEVVPLRELIRVAGRRWTLEESIATTAGAWAAGLLVFTTVATPLWQPGQALPLIIAIGVLGGLVMAATVAGLTGAAAVRLLGLPADPAVGAKS